MSKETTCAESYEHFLYEFASRKVDHQKGDGILTASTKKTYASKWKEAFKEKFNRHDFWKDPDDWKNYLLNLKQPPSVLSNKVGMEDNTKFCPSTRAFLVYQVDRTLSP